ncbi:DUF4236 domain-containing protein [Nocardioides sp. NPDC004968]|uniref:DUF4236 domain-containing protein n=1 Tax=Nocardioides sp. NPDC004968 TaxID=3155894 RepID=UPI00339F172C
MGFRIRKQIKILPGIKLTVTPHGVSTTLGPKGFSLNVHSKRRVTGTVDLPGSGVHYVKTTSVKRIRAKMRGGSEAAPAVSSPAAPEPGFFSPAWEKKLFRALAEKRYDRIAGIGERYDDARPSAVVLDSILVAHPGGDMARVRDDLSWLRSVGRKVEDDAFIATYAAGGEVSVHIAAGVDVALPLSQEILDLLLVEALQAGGDLDRAIDVAEGLEPTTIAAVSLAELYIDAGRFDDVIEVTNALVNEDEASTFLMVQRAAALRQTGLLEAALEALREALQPRSRPAELRLAAYLERAQVYVAQGKKGMARKDLERVIAADASIPGVRDLLDSLTPEPAPAD